MVVAESRYAAEDAAARVAVEYEQLPVVSDIRAAVRDGGVMVRREAPSNVLQRLKVAYGDVSAAFVTAAHVFREELWQHRGCAHPMETRGGRRRMPTGRFLNIWSSTQMPNDLFQAIAEATRIEEDRLRIITPTWAAGTADAMRVVATQMDAATAEARGTRCRRAEFAVRRRRRLSPDR